MTRPIREGYVSKSIKVTEYERKTEILAKRRDSQLGILCTATGKVDNHYERGGVWAVSMNEDKTYELLCYMHKV